MSPFALMALAMAGGASVAISSETSTDTPVQDDNNVSSADSVVPDDAVLVDNTAEDETSTVVGQINDLIQGLLAENATTEPGLNTAATLAMVGVSESIADLGQPELSAVSDASATDSEAEIPVLFAQASTEVSDAVDYGAEAIETDSTMTTMVALGVGLAGAAIATSSSSSSSSSDSQAVNPVADTTAPLAPKASLATDSGVTTDSITHVGTVNVTGLETGASWQYSTDAGVNWTAGSGTSVTLTGDGVKSVIVRQTDAAGNVGVASSALAFTLDSTAAAPSLSLATNSGVTTDGITNVGTVNVTGLETGASWQYSTDAGVNWTAGSGTSVTLTGDGVKSVTVRQADAAGNVGMASGALAFTLDSTAAAPTLSLATDSGVADGITNVGTVNVTGLETGASWQYSTDAGVNWMAGSGTSVTLTGDGAKSVTVRQTDVAGNISAASSALTFTLDSAAPLAPAAALTTDSGVATDGITNVGTVNVTGLETGASWQYRTDAGVNWTAGSGTSVTLTGDGAKSVTVRQADAAGNVGVASSALAFTLDSTAAAPTLSLATNSGVATDGITNVGTVNVTGLETGASWQYSTDAGVNWTAGSGTSVTLTGEGVKSVIVRQTDVAGNVGVASGALAFTLDSTAAAPTLSLATDSGATDGVTNVGTVNVTGLETGASWQYSTDAGVNWTAGSGTSVTLTGDGAKSVIVHQTDVAGNVSVASDALNFTIDATAPVIQSLTAHSSTHTIDLTYDSALDGIHLPLISAFKVATGGASNTVESVVSGSVLTLTLTLKDPFAANTAVSLIYTDGDNANTVQDIQGNVAVGYTKGIVADGYVRGAQIYIDTNKNGTPDATEKLDGVVTDANGNFFLPSTALTGTIIAMGGVNIDTGVSNTMALKAPEGSITINPLTTLVQAVIQASGGTTTSADAAAAVATNLGLNNIPAGQSLLNYDPLSANDVTAQRATAQVATIVTLAEKAGAGATVIGNLVTQLNSAGSSGTTVNLSDSGTISSVLGNSMSGADQSAIADASISIGQATSLSAISTAQGQALDKVAAQAPTLTVAANTNDTTPSVRVTFNTTAIDGTAAVVGNSLVLKDAGIQIGAVVTLNADDIAAGYKNVDTTPLAEGAHHLTATLTDQAGNTSSAAVEAVVAIDTQAPSAPMINVVAGDDRIGIIEQATTLTGSAEASTTVYLLVGNNIHTIAANSDGGWSYTLNSSDIATMGQGAVSLLATAATDLAGNVSIAGGTRTIQVDTIAPAITVVVTGADSNVAPNIGNIVAGATTNDNTLGLSGTISATIASDEVVAVYDGASRLGEATVSSSTWSFNTSSLANTAHSFSARVEDAAGNNGIFSNAYVVTVNASVPVATATITTATDDVAQGLGTVPSGGLSNDKSPVLAGVINGTIGSDQVVIYDGAARLGAATVNGSNWSYTPTALATGNHSLTAAVENTGGNQGNASSAYNITIDTIAPVAPIIDKVALNDIVSASEQTVVIGGSAEAGASVDLSIGGNIRSVTATDSGNWRYPLTADDITAMGQGEEILGITVTDKAGNVSSTVTRTILVDTIGATTTIHTIAGDDAINAGELAGGVVITGTSDANASIALTLGSGNIRSATADGTGAWTYSLNSADISSMGQGSETITAAANDSAGNTGTVATRNITIDSVAPVLTSFSLTDASDSGTKGDGKSSVAAPVIQFTTELGSALAIDQGAGFVSVGTGTGSLQSLAVPTAFAIDVSYTLQLKATDAAGNSTVRTGSYVFDSTPPNAPSVTSVVDDAAPVVGSVANNGLSNDTALVINGTAEAFAKVSVLNGTTELGTTQANSSGAWTLTTPTLTNGSTYAFNAKATDASGNTGSASANHLVTIDTSLPAVTPLSPSDGGISPGLASNLTLGANETVVKGTGTVSLYSTDALVQSIDVTSDQVVISGVGGNSQISINPTADLVKDQAYYVKVSAGALVDLAGNAWAGINDTTSWNFTGAGATVLINDVAVDNTVNLAESKGAITVTGTLGADSTVLSAYHSSDMTAVLHPASGADIALTNYTYTSGSTGSWSADIAPYALGGTSDYSLIVSFSGSGGVGTKLVHVDTVVAAPTVALVTNSGVGTDDITNVGTITVTGLETGATWQYSTDAGVNWINGSGTSATLTGDGAKSVTVHQTDVAGNVSADSGTLAFTLDSTAAAAPTLSLATNSGVTTDAITNIGTVNVTGLEAGASWQYSTDAGVNWINGSGSTVTLTGDGAKSVTVHQTDVAGNVSTDSGALAFTLDSTVAAPTLSLATNSGVTTDSITNVGTVNVTGLETGASWQYSTDAGVNWINGSGSTVTLTGDGDKSLTVHQTDVAGNTSAASNAVVFTLDSSAPSLAISDHSSNPTTGALTFGFAFNEAVSGFDVNDINVVNATKGTFTTTDASHYSLEMMPTSSTTPLAMTVDVAASAATDVAGDASSAASQFLASVLYGTSGNDILTVGSALDHIFTGGGADVVKLVNTTDSTVALPDNVIDFGQGDKIDLHALLGTGGSGYTASGLGNTDTGAGFVELKNVTLTQDATNNWTVVNFDIKLDANTIGVSKIDGMNLDLGYDASKVIYSQITSPQYLVGPSLKPVWSPLDGNYLSTDQGAHPTGKIALPANFSGENPIIVDPSTGNVLNVKLYVSGLLVNTFDVAIESKASGGSTDIHTADGVTTYVDVGIAKTAGATTGSNGYLEIIADTSALTTVGDNQLHMASSYDATTNTTHLQVQYDTNPTIGTTTLGNIIAFDFDGNVTANLTPASLMYL